MVPPATEQSFRSNLSQFRWARGVTDDSQRSQPSQTSSTTSTSNPFSRFYNAVGDYVPLRSSETSNEEEAWVALSRWERLIGFAVCLVGAAVCFFVAFFITLPLIAIRPAKFALAFSLGSLLVMFGFSVLIGPINHLKHLLSPERIPFSLIYFSSLAITIYFSIGLHSYIGSLVGAIVQVVALVSYVLAYFPGGTQTLRFGAQLALRGAGSLLPR